MTRERSDAPFEPRVPLALAETSVDFAALKAEILYRRERIEKAVEPDVLRIAYAIARFGIEPQATVAALAARLERELQAVALGGYRAAREEVKVLRRNLSKPRETEKDLSKIFELHAVPDAGRFAVVATAGLRGVYYLLRLRSQRTAVAVTTRIRQRYGQLAGQADAARDLFPVGSKQLHLHVLEQVGETLNLGRTAGVMTMPERPEFAMRSEQLDKRTCVPCGELHGTIARVGTPEYFAILPPSGCLGGGRCRAVMVFADEERDVRGPEPSEEELARIRREARGGGGGGRGRPPAPPGEPPDFHPDRIPRSENAEIDDAKITDYLLVGDKARLFAGLGYTLENWQDLRAALLYELPRVKGEFSRANPIAGENWRADIELRGPTGQALIRTVWQLVAGQRPRLITAYRSPRRRSG